MTGKAVKTVRKATPLATEIRDWLRRARTGERIVYHQPYDYKYVIPQDLLAKDGHPNTIKTSKYIEEHVKQRSQPLAKYNPLKNPWQLFNTVMLAFVVPYVLWTTFSRGKLNKPYGFGSEAKGLKRRYAGYTDPKYWPSYEEMKATEAERNYSLVEKYDDVRIKLD
mmetsp:Transcript_38058/g.151111  ORF Transcript_38058/g.151111 Transcript_38058/m.151111 type:complete len:166 (-) Transcript_38058:128-625(-)|eukprot:CAMPEP_0113954098 /NCGR_PEP_ID=MMETSP0011_2-20120614/263_1 /TAXON_ID=101924 /ORGANISM="Rhodosorus marinus" /LENGTH=165 /DNA_ID=CAMNT_0000962987 /DNA_START=84 /DNA_END=581 /DNA_ORIENTATION=- /assembly_acc=CAM_ASM_000156